MADVKISNDQLEQIATKAQEAKTNIETLKSTWDSKFGALSSKASQGTESAYKQLTSNYSALTVYKEPANPGYKLLNTSIGNALHACVIKNELSQDGQNTGNPTWVETAKEALIAKIDENRAGGEAFSKITELEEKTTNLINNIGVIVGMVAAYEADGADLTAALGEYDSLKGAVFENGVLTDIQTAYKYYDTDGKEHEVNISVAEAMNAFYTYANTVTAGELAGQYMVNQYGANIDFNGIVNNAGGMTAAAAKSGLFSNEFIQTILPKYEDDPKKSGAYDNIAKIWGDQYNADNVASVLGSLGLGDSALAGALLAAGAFGAIGDVSLPSQPETSSTTNPTNPTNPTSPGPGGTNPGGTNPATTETPTNTVPTPTDTVTTPTPTVETPTTIDIPTIEPLEDITMPEGEELYINDLETDYDELAREFYENLSEEELNARRKSIIDVVNDAFDKGNLDSLKENLIKFGYSEPEAAAIIQDRELLIDAMLVGDANSYVANKAVELAKAAGVEDFNTAYDDPAKYNDLLTGSAKDILANVNNSKEVTDARTTMTDAQKEYNTTLEEANKSLGTIRESKKTMEDTYNKYKEKFGEDTSKWSSEAVSEYKTSIEKYNTDAADFKTKYEAMDKAKTTYKESIDGYKEARKTYLESVREVHGADDGAVATTSGNPTVSSVGMNGDNPSAVAPIESGDTSGISTDDAMNLFN